MKCYVCNPRGYCAGVIKAITKAKKTKKMYSDRPIYVFGMLVHNEDVKDSLLKEGIITIEDTSNYKEVINNLPSNSVLIFTAHGHKEEIESYAKEKGLITVDTTCEIVKKNLDLIRNAIKNNKDVIYIGKNNHPETTAAISLSENVHLLEIGKDFDYASVKESPLVLNQTTLSHLELKDTHDIIKDNIPSADIIDEICDATKIRQLSVLNIPSEVDLIIIVGGKKSSNTKKLYEIATSKYPNVKVMQVLNAEEINKNDLLGHNYAAIASGTSTPIEITNKVIELIKSI